MKQSVTIKIDQLPDGAKREMADFYEYLLHKYSTKMNTNKAVAMTKIPRVQSVQKAFFKKIKEFSFDIPKDYHFDRESLYDR
jgi:exoribonuclease R